MHINIYQSFCFLLIISISLKLVDDGGGGDIFLNRLLLLIFAIVLNAGVWGGGDSIINLNFNLILINFKIKTQKHLSK